MLKQVRKENGFEFEMMRSGFPRLRSIEYMGSTLKVGELVSEAGCDGSVASDARMCVFNVYKLIGCETYVGVSESMVGDGLYKFYLFAIGSERSVELQQLREYDRYLRAFMEDRKQMIEIVESRIKFMERCSD